MSNLGRSQTSVFAPESIFEKISEEKQSLRLEHVVHTAIFQIAKRNATGTLREANPDLLEDPVPSLFVVREKVSNIPVLLGKLPQKLFIEVM